MWYNGRRPNHRDTLNIFQNLLGDELVSAITTKHILTGALTFLPSFLGSIHRLASRSYQVINELVHNVFLITLKIKFFEINLNRSWRISTTKFFFWSFSNLYSNLIWSFWVASGRKIKIWIRGKKVQFITEKGGLWAFLAWKLNFQ